jgi:hypothetical protein
LDGAILDTTLTSPPEIALLILRVKRLASILLLLAFAALASGALEYLHNTHSEDALHDGGGGTPRHDDSNCDVHRQLHAPALAAHWLPTLVLMGLFVAFLTLLAPRLAAQRTLERIACRGPPAC